MTQLYLLKGIQEIDDLRVRIEVVLGDIRYLTLKVGKIRNALFDIQSRLRHLQETIKLLRSDGCKIVSLAEYTSLILEINQAMACEKNTQRQLAAEQLIVDRLFASAQEMEDRIDFLQNTYGKVLEFKQRE